MYLYLHDMLQVFNIYCVHFQCGCCLGTITILVLLETCKLCLVRPCGHSLPQAEQTEKIYHKHDGEQSTHFFLRLLLLEEVFRSHTKDKHYIRVLFTKGDWKLLLSRFFFCSVLPFFATLNFETYGD